MIRRSVQALVSGFFVGLGLVWADTVIAASRNPDIQEDGHGASSVASSVRTEVRTTA